MRAVNSNMKFASLTLIALLTLSACGDGSFRRPTASNKDADTMSAETLCYRNATAKKSEAVDAEVKSRNLDCAAILQEDPLYNDKAQGLPDR